VSGVAGRPAEGRARLRALRAHLAEPLFSGAYSLMASTASTALLGLVFWAVAARLYSSAAVGRDALLIVSLTTLSSICQLNLFDSIVRFLPAVAPSRRALRIAMGYGVSALASVLGGTAFVLVAPHVSRQLRFLSARPGLAIVYVVSVAFWTVFALEDAVLTTLRRPHWLPFENVSFSAAKIVLLPAMLALGAGDGIYLGWVAPLVAIVPVVNVLLYRRVLAPEARAPLAEPLPTIDRNRRRLLRFLAADYGGYVFSLAPATLLPLVVVAHLGDSANAYFSVPMTLVFAFDLLFLGVTTSLIATAARTIERTRALTRIVTHRFLALLVPTAGLVALIAPLLLVPFGSAYSHHGTAVLRLLIAASPARAVIVLFGALSRLRTRGRPILLTQAATFAVSLGLAVAFVGPLGIAGVALAWLIANGAVAVAVLPLLVRSLRGL